MGLAVLDPREAGLAQDVARPDHARRDAAGLEVLLDPDSVDLLVEHEGVAHPGRLDLRRRLGSDDRTVVLREGVVESRELALASPVELVELVQLHQAVGRHDLGRLEVVAHVVEDEDQVVGRAVGERAEALVCPLRLPKR